MFAALSAKYLNCRLKKTRKIAVNSFMQKVLDVWSRQAQSPPRFLVRELISRTRNKEGPVVEHRAL